MHGGAARFRSRGFVCSVISLLAEHCFFGAPDFFSSSLEGPRTPAAGVRGFVDRQPDGYRVEKAQGWSSLECRQARYTVSAVGYRGLGRWSNAKCVHSSTIGFNDNNQLTRNCHSSCPCEQREHHGQSRKLRDGVAPVVWTDPSDGVAHGVSALHQSRGGCRLRQRQLATSR